MGRGVEEGGHALLHWCYRACSRVSAKRSTVISFIFGPPEHQPMQTIGLLILLAGGLIWDRRCWREARSKSPSWALKPECNTCKSPFHLFEVVQCSNPMQHTSYVLSKKIFLKDEHGQHERTVSLSTTTPLSTAPTLSTKHGEPALWPVGAHAP
jgi:hypothetical protein